MIHFSMSKNKQKKALNTTARDVRIKKEGEKSTRRRERSVKKPSGSGFGKQELQKMHCKGKIVAKHWRRVLCMHIYIFCVPVSNQHCVSVDEELKVHVSEMFAKKRKSTITWNFFITLNKSTCVNRQLNYFSSERSKCSFQPKLKAHFIAVLSQPFWCFFLIFFFLVKFKTKFIPDGEAFFPSCHTLVHFQC